MPGQTPQRYGSVPHVPDLELVVVSGCVRAHPPISAAVSKLHDSVPNHHRLSVPRARRLGPTVLPAIDRAVHTRREVGGRRGVPVASWYLCVGWHSTCVHSTLPHDIATPQTRWVRAGARACVERGAHRAHEPARVRRLDQGGSLGRARVPAIGRSARERVSRRLPWRGQATGPSEQPAQWKRG